MARLYNAPGFPSRGNSIPGVRKVYGRWPIGSTGAVGTAVRETGVSLTRTDVGAYTLQLRDSGSNAFPVKVLNCNIELYVNDTDPTDDTDGHYVKRLAISDANGTVTFQCQDEGGVVREAPSGAVICVELTITMSSVTR